MSWAAAAAAAAAVGAVWVAYGLGRDAGQAAERADRLADEQLVDAAGDKAASAAAAAIARLRVVQTTITQEVRREIETRPVYRDCQHSAEQLRRINAALTGEPGPEPAGGGQLPQASAAD